MVHIIFKISHHSTFKCLTFQSLDVVTDFEEPEYSVVENGTFVEVCVLITEGTLERNLTLTLSTRDQTAVGRLKPSLSQGQKIPTLVNPHVPGVVNVR